MAYFSTQPGADVYSRPHEKFLPFVGGPNTLPYTTCGVMLSTVGTTGLTCTSAAGDSVTLGTSTVLGQYIPVAITAITAANTATGIAFY
jgi:hypothetical protein